MDQLFTLGGHLLRCVRAVAAIVCASVFLCSGANAEVGIQDLVGYWHIPQNRGVLLVTRRGEWHHPKFGYAKILRGSGAADVEVEYALWQTKCSYTVNMTDGGRGFILGAAHPSEALSPEDAERCPTGLFKAADR